MCISTSSVGEAMSRSYYSTIIEAPRWAGLEKCIRDNAFMCGVVNDTTYHTGWVFVTAYLHVSGDKDRVARFKQMMIESMSQYEEQLQEDSS